MAEVNFQLRKLPSPDNQVQKTGRRGQPVAKHASLPPPASVVMPDGHPFASQVLHFQFSFNSTARTARTIVDVPLSSENILVSLVRFKFVLMFI